MTYNLLDLATVLRSYGRGALFHAVSDVNDPLSTELWSPGSGPLNLVHSGDSEGDFSMATNPTMAPMTLPELTGDAVHEMDYMGENPVVNVPLYLADPIYAALFSPSGTVSAGASRRRAAHEFTAVILPEQLMLQVIGGVPTRVPLSAAAGVWQVNGQPIDAARQALLDAGAGWLWRVTPARPPRRWRGGGGNDKKNIEEVSLQLMHHPDMPEGHHLYTIGDPFDSGIDVETGGS